jgi:hypothetical protein
MELRYSPENLIYQFHKAGVFKDIRLIYTEELRVG